MAKKTFTNLYDTLDCRWKGTNPTEPTKFGAYLRQVTNRANKRDGKRPEDDKSGCDGVRNRNAYLPTKILALDNRIRFSNQTFISYGLRLRLAQITSDGWTSMYRLPMYKSVKDFKENLNDTHSFDMAHGERRPEPQYAPRPAS